MDAKDVALPRDLRQEMDNYAIAVENQTKAARALLDAEDRVRRARESVDAAMRKALAGGADAAGR